MPHAHVKWTPEAIKKLANVADFAKLLNAASALLHWHGGKAQQTRRQQCFGQKADQG